MSERYSFSLTTFRYAFTYIYYDIFHCWSFYFKEYFIVFVFCCDYLILKLGEIYIKKFLKHVQFLLSHPFAAWPVSLSLENVLRYFTIVYYLFLTIKFRNCKIRKLLKSVCKNYVTVSNISILKCLLGTLTALILTLKALRLLGKRKENIGQLEKKNNSYRNWKPYRC